jgi:hypothetical protein
MFQCYIIMRIFINFFPKLFHFQIFSNVFKNFKNYKSFCYILDLFFGILEINK